MNGILKILDLGEGIAVESLRVWTRGFFAETTRTFTSVIARYAMACDACFTQNCLAMMYASCVRDVEYASSLW